MATNDRVTFITKKLDNLIQDETNLGMLKQEVDLLVDEYGEEMRIEFESDGPITVKLISPLTREQHRLAKIAQIAGKKGGVTRRDMDQIKLIAEGRADAF